MRHFNEGRDGQQVQFLRRQFLQQGELPFTDFLTEELVGQAMAEGIVLLTHDEQIRRYDFAPVRYV